VLFLVTQEFDLCPGTASLDAAHKATLPLLDVRDTRGSRKGPESATEFDPGAGKQFPNALTGPHEDANQPASSNPAELADWLGSAHRIAAVRLLILSAAQEVPPLLPRTATLPCNWSTLPKLISSPGVRSGALLYVPLIKFLSNSSRKGGSREQDDSKAAMVTREELYDLVWWQPMTKVCEQFNVSSNYMAAELLPDIQPGEPLT